VLLCRLLLAAVEGPPPPLSCALVRRLLAALLAAAGRLYSSTGCAEERALLLPLLCWLTCGAAVWPSVAMSSA
jgi:hypothetical protein